MKIALQLLKNLSAVVLAGSLFAGCSKPVAPESTTQDITWNQLPSLPDKQGFAGGFAGVSHGSLLFAGGANFPDAPPWGGGKKVWYDSIFVLSSADGPWKKLEQVLPRPLAYGVSVTHKDKLICIGGDDGKKAFRDVFSVELRQGKAAIEELPSLPAPSTGITGALIGDRVYIAGGLDRLEDQSSLARKSFWMLDLSAPDKGWSVLPVWPGPERFEAVSAAIDGKFFLFSGFRLQPGATSGSQRKFPVLRDGYKFTPSETTEEGTWKAIADVPRGVAASPSPAPVLGDDHFLVIGGVDDDSLRTPQGGLAHHPGFSTQCLAYSSITDTWIPLGTFPDTTARVNVPTTIWNKTSVILSGEARPGIRSPRVFLVEIQHTARSFGFLNYSVLVTYLLALIAMGVYFSRREKTTEDFFVAGRRVPWWAAGISIFGTQLSSITFMATPAKVYATDWLYYVGTFALVLVQPLVVYFYLPFFRRLNITSVYEYLEQRFNLAVRLFGSASFILFQLGRMTIVLFLPALALSAVTGINIYISIVVMGILATLYTMLGGIEAVIWTDVLQVAVLLGAGLLSLGIIIGNLDGGIGTIVDVGLASDKFRFADFRWDYALPVFWVFFIGKVFENIISYSSDQAVVQRYLTTPDEKSSAAAIWTNAALTIPVSLVWFGLGTALYVFYKTHPAQLSPALKTDQTFPLFIAQELPPGVVGLVIAGLFAAAMSTIDSSLNSITAALTTDFWHRFRPKIDEQHSLRFARKLTLLLGIIGTSSAIWIAMNQDEIRSLWDVYTRVIGLLMGGLGGLFALGVFTQRVSGSAALIGAVAGAGVCGWVAYGTRVNFFLYPVIGVSTCFVVGYLLSLRLPNRKDLKGLTIHTRR